MRESKNLLYLFILIVILQSCSSTNDLFQKGEYLVVKRIAVQRIVPGMPKPPPYDQLLIQVEINDSELKLDSVYYESRVYFFELVSAKELTLDQSKPCNDLNYIENPGSAVIFYHIKAKNYYQPYKEVIRLGDLVMP